MKNVSILVFCALVGLMFASCDTYRHTMKDANAKVELYASDFELSEPVTGEATITKIVYVDWEHLFGTSKTGDFESPTALGLPIIGNFMPAGGANYAIYDMLQKNPGYDVVFYPQIEEHKKAPVLGTDIYSTTTYKVTARLGKLKKK